MKKSIWLLITLLFSYSTFAQQSNNAKVTDVVVNFFEALSAFDDAKMKANVTPDFLLLENGLVWNIDTLINKVAPYKSAGFSRTNSFNFFKTERKKNTAWVAYNNKAHFKVNGQEYDVQWLESVFLVKQRGQWKIKLMHSTKL